MRRRRDDARDRRAMPVVPEALYVGVDDRDADVAARGEALRCWCDTYAWARRAPALTTKRDRRRARRLRLEGSRCGPDLRHLFRDVDRWAAAQRGDQSSSLVRRQRCVWRRDGAIALRDFIAQCFEP
jgi:hypothetical protein